MSSNYAVMNPVPWFCELTAPEVPLNRYDIHIRFIFRRSHDKLNALTGEKLARLEQCSLRRILPEQNHLLQWHWPHIKTDLSSKVTEINVPPVCGNDAKCWILSHNADVIRKPDIFFLNDFRCWNLRQNGNTESQIYVHGGIELKESRAQAIKLYSTRQSCESDVGHGPSKRARVMWPACDSGGRSGITTSCFHCGFYPVPANVQVQIDLGKRPFTLNST